MASHSQCLTVQQFGPSGQVVIVARRQCVAPDTGEVLAERGERDPERVLDYLSACRQLGDIPDWLWSWLMEGSEFTRRAGV